MKTELSRKQVLDIEHGLKNRMKELREEVRQELLKSDNEHFVDFAGRVYDLEDQSVADLLVDLNLASIDRHIAEMREIDAAIIHIAEQNYGICSHCNGVIPASRLLAHPTASRCLKCQDIREKTYASSGNPSL